MTGLNYETDPKGKLVNKGAENLISNDYKVKLPTDATIPVGWAGFEQTTYQNRPASLDTAYAT